MTPNEIIQKSILEHRLSHLYLITGSKGEYRDQKILEVVQTLSEDTSSDKAALIEKQKVTWIETETHVIKKQQIQDLFKEFSKTSLQNLRKIYVIEDAEKLNTTSANTLLKFLEEPDSKTSVGILVTDNQYALLDTIISRAHILKIAEPTIKEKKTLFKSKTLSPFEIEVFTLLFQNLEEATNANASSHIKELLVLFDYMLDQYQTKNFEFELYELSSCLNDKDTLMQFVQLCLRFLIDLRTDSQHIHFNSKQDVITHISDHIDMLSLDESISSLKDILKQMRYFVSNELQKRHVLHIIKSLFDFV